MDAIVWTKSENVKLQASKIKAVSEKAVFGLCIQSSLLMQHYSHTLAC